MSKKTSKHSVFLDQQVIHKRALVEDVFKLAKVLRAQVVHP